MKQRVGADPVCQRFQTNERFADMHGAVLDLITEEFDGSEDFVGHW